jgi:hypothetical protein
MEHEQLSIAALQRFARSRPWRGSIAERQQKFNTAIYDICVAAGATPPNVIFAISEQEDSGQSCYFPATNTIVLSKCSVITALHEIGHLLLGRSEYAVCAWSLALFRRCFPKSWSRLTFDGHMALARPTAASPEHPQTP